VEDTVQLGFHDTRYRAWIRRFDKTLEKLRRGGLPPVTANHRREVTAGLGQQCDGCDDWIGRYEQLHRLIVEDTVRLGFHDACYRAWVNYIAER
jgi:hypothetical protein